VTPLLCHFENGGTEQEKHQKARQAHNSLLNKNGKKNALSRSMTSQRDKPVSVSTQLRGRDDAEQLSGEVVPKLLD
jgi:hypothetical protein